MTEKEMAMESFACFKSHLRNWLNESKRKNKPVGILERAEMLNTIDKDISELFFGKRKGDKDDE